jgi:hypothetical protein
VAVETAWLLDRAAAYLRVHARLADTRPLVERALAITEAALGPDHAEVAARLNNRAWSFGIWGWRGGAAAGRAGAGHR